jgi:hypothetical protein
MVADHQGGRHQGRLSALTATNDRALAPSGRIAAGMTRVGAAEKAATERLGVRVFDASG